MESRCYSRSTRQSIKSVRLSLWSLLLLTVALSSTSMATETSDEIRIGKTFVIPTLAFSPTMVTEASHELDPHRSFNVPYDNLIAVTPQCFRPTKKLVFSDIIQLGNQVVKEHTQDDLDLPKRKCTYLARVGNAEVYAENYLTTPITIAKQLVLDFLFHLRMRCYPQNKNKCAPAVMLARDSSAPPPNAWLQRYETLYYEMDRGLLEEPSQNWDWPWMKFE